MDTIEWFRKLFIQPLDYRINTKHKSNNYIVPELRVELDMIE